MRQIAVWTVALMMTLGATAVMFAENKQGNDKEEQGGAKITLADCPAAVQKTLTREARGGEIEAIEKETEHGKTVYEAEIEIDGHDYEVVVDEQGLLLKKTLEKAESSETSIKLEECPAAVQKTLKLEAGGAKIDKVDKQIAGGHAIYEIDVEIDGRNYEVLVSGEGVLLSKQLDEGEEEDQQEDKKVEKSK